MRSLTLTLAFVLAAAATAAACGEDERQSKPTDNCCTGRDAGPRDAIAPPIAIDSGLARDATPDAGSARDAIVLDTGAADADPIDTGVHGTGFCAGKPCLTSIATPADWATIAKPALPAARCDLDQELFFMMPAGPNAAIQDTLYIDARAHARMFDFVRVELASQVGALDPQQYFQRFERDGQREYVTGRLFRKTDPAGPTTYAFDVTSPELGLRGGVLDQRAIESIHARLSATFALPLGYAPQANSGIDRAETFRGTTFPVHLPAPCPGEECAGGVKPCLIVPAGARACGQFITGRNPEIEVQRKARLFFASGSFPIPTTEATMSIDLIAGGELGPSRTPITPLGSGRFTVRNINGQLIRTYTQEMMAGAARLSLEWEIWVYGARNFIIREPLDEQMGIWGTLNGVETSEEMIRFGPCERNGMDLYFAEAKTAEGINVLLEYRHEVPVSNAAQLIPISARVDVGGNRTIVNDYFRLVYTGEYHNLNNKFWVLFEPPLSFSGHPIHGIEIDEPRTSCCPPDSITTLDANRRPLDTLTVQSYTRAPRL